ncbi:MAG: TolC family protein, partial [Gammaproteobacteria bacterium]|nr:TolC family protein [Gammaproteobacteria bacterium]
RSETIKQIRQAYFGYIAANNTELFLEDTRKRIDGARMRVEKWLEDGSGSAKQSDLYAVQTAIDVLTGLVAAAEGLKKVAAAGLKVLTASKEDVFPEESRISPLPLPEDDLETLKEHALKQRPEMEQVASGLEARRALVNAEKAMARPNIYTGVVGFSSYSPGRDRIDNPVITDVFNDYGATPVIGLQWSWEGGKSSAKTAQAKAELNALVAKASFARAGIPFEVAEAYHQVHAYRKMVDNLQKGVRSARRWMISTLTDFEAGLEKSDKLVSAFQGYVLANTEYLKTVYTYNMHVTQLELVVGAYK